MRCAYDEVEEGLAEIGSNAVLVNLEPSSIEGIFNTISTIGAMTAAEDEAVGLLEMLREHLADIENRVLERRLDGIRPPRVVCLEWLDPPFAAGHWVPEQVRRAGGWELLGQAGERSVETTWERVRDVDPDELLLMPCGSDAVRTAAEWSVARKPAWLSELRAVREGAVFALDGSSYFSRPGPPRRRRDSPAGRDIRSRRPGRSGRPAAGRLAASSRRLSGWPILGGDAARE